MAAEGLLTLILFSLAMGFASYGAGLLPLTIPLSPKRMRFLSTIGMGVLVGTSLIVIIPEGINTLYNLKSPQVDKRDVRLTGTAGVIRRWSSTSEAPTLVKRDLGRLGDLLGKRGAEAEGSGHAVAVEVGLKTFHARREEKEEEGTKEDHPSTRIPVPTATTTTKPGHDHKDDDDDDDDDKGKDKKKGKGDDDDDKGKDKKKGKDDDDGDSDSDSDDDDGDHKGDKKKKKHSHKNGRRDPHSTIGFSLIFGFILMYLIDTLPPFLTSFPFSGKQPYISLNNLSSPPPSSHTTSAQYHRSATSSSSPTNSPSPPPTTSTSSPTTPRTATLYPALHPFHDITPSSKSFSTTTGLVIHACADGIALGASTTSGSNISLSLIIFIAIMLHKAPAAFGLCAVLLKKGLSKRQARTHLLVFSLAAPVGALVTWLIVNILGGGGDSLRMQWWTGVLLLFSGGTFLYVAMHTMEEVERSHGVHGYPGYVGRRRRFGINGAGRGGEGDDEEERFLPQRMEEVEDEEERERTVWDTIAAVAGMLLPLLTQLGGHGHAH